MDTESQQSIPLEFYTIIPLIYTAMKGTLHECLHDEG